MKLGTKIILIWLILGIIYWTINIFYDMGEDQMFTTFCTTFITFGFLTNKLNYNRWL